MTKDEMTQRIINFIRKELLPEEMKLEIDETAPLLRLGILNSLKTAILMNYMRDELRISIPVEELNSEDFESVESIIALIEKTRTSQ